MKIAAGICICVSIILTFSLLGIFATELTGASYLGHFAAFGGAFLGGGIIALLFIG